MASPYYFAFDANNMQTAGYLERADLRVGTYPGLEYGSGYYSAIAPEQAISTYGGVDVFAMTLLAGQSYKFDLDRATTSLEFDIINSKGKLVGGGASFDSFTPGQTGTFFIVVHHASNDYTGEFEWQRDTSSTGSYELYVSAPTSSQPSASNTFNYSDARQSYSFYGRSEEVRGNGGADYFELRGGNDIGLGGAGNDTILGEAGSDELSGGSGYDRLSGGSGDDVLRGASEADALYGGGERDNLFGGTGKDYLSGGSGNDTMWGGSGADTLRGGDGADFLRGGSGLDILTGGGGRDVFHFLRGEAPASSNHYQLSSHDRIEDFNYNQNDVIDLSDLSRTELSFRGTSVFTGSNQVRYVSLSNGYREVQVNLGGSLDSDLDIMVDIVGPGGLVRDDFLL